MKQSLDTRIQTIYWELLTEQSIRIFGDRSICIYIFCKYIYYIYIYTYVCIHIYICMYTYIHMYVYIYTYMYVYIYTYVCIHIYRLMLWNMNFIFPIQLGMSSSQLTNSIFGKCWGMNLHSYAFAGSSCTFSEALRMVRIQQRLPLV